MFPRAVVWLIVFCGASSALAGFPRGVSYYVQPGTPYLNLEPPGDPPAQADLDRWARILGASEEQRHFMGIMYTKFVERYNQHMSREAPKYLQLSAELAKLYLEHGMDAEPTYAAARELDRMRSVLHAGVESITQQLVNSFEPVLTPEQAERLATVRHDISRRVCRGGYHPDVRWADVELRPVWEATAASLASPEEVAAVSAILADYEARLTSLVCRWDQLLIERRRRQQDDRMAVVGGAVTPEEGRNRYLRMMDERHHAGAAVRELNKQTVAIIAGVLSNGLADRFVASARTAAFPEIHPDRAALHEFLHALRTDEQLSERDANAVAMLSAAYAADYNRIIIRMEQFVEDWSEQLSRGASGYQSQFLRSELSPLMEERRDLSVKTLAKLGAALGDPDWRERNAAALPETLRPGVLDGADEPEPNR